ncbi:DUF120 domain-containing protein [Methanosphaera sp.]
MALLEGTVHSGLQKASKFMEKSVYKEQYPNKLGFEPYPGTLNVKLKNNITLDIENKLAPQLKKIEGNEQFGDVFFLEASLSIKENTINKKGAILFPVKTVYKTDTLEFICEEKLRDTLNLKDGSTVILEINY